MGPKVRQAARIAVSISMFASACFEPGVLRSTDDATEGASTEGTNETGDGDGDTGDGDGDGDAGDGDTGDGDTGDGDGDGDTGDGDGDAGDGDGDGEPPPAPIGLSLDLSPIKTFEFSWQPARGTDSYQLWEHDGGAPVLLQTDLSETTSALERALHLSANAQYTVRACNSFGCSNDSTVAVPNQPLEVAVGYFKSSNPNTDDRFGSSVGLSADGSTLAVGTPFEDSQDANQPHNNLASNSGAVYIFGKVNGTWEFLTYLKAPVIDSGDGFGHAVSLSADGTRLVVGAPGEDGSDSGLGGDLNDDASSNSGAAYVFDRNGDSWMLATYMKASNVDANDSFGTAVAIAADGMTVIIGAPGEDSSAIGVGGQQSDDTTLSSGAAYVFKHEFGWSQDSYLKPTNTGAGDEFGAEVAISSDGNTVVIGAPGEASSSAQSPADNSMPAAGAAYVFTRVNAWQQRAYLKAPFPGSNDGFGTSLSIAGDVPVVVVGAPSEDSNEAGTAGLGANDDLSDAGAAYVFEQSGGSWTMHTYIKPSNPGFDDGFGSAVKLSADGTLLVIGAINEAGGDVGIGGNESDNSAPDAGAGYVFSLANDSWTQQTYVKSSNTDSYDGFGATLDLSADGQTLVIAATSEDGNAIGVGGAQANNTTNNAGAVYMF